MKNKNEEQIIKDRKFKERRDFLKKSAYVAYASPVIMNLLIESNAAAQTTAHDSSQGASTWEKNNTGYISNPWTPGGSN